MNDNFAVTPCVQLPSPQVPLSDIEYRMRQIRSQMEAAGVSVLICSSHQNVEYFSGYRTMSWTSNTRPVYFVIDAEHAVLIGSMTEQRNIARRDWAFSTKHYQGFVDDAIVALLDHIKSVVGTGRPTVGFDFGEDMFGRGSITLTDTLRQRGALCRDCADLIWRVRLIKSRYEAEMKRAAFTIVNRAFDTVIAKAHVGCTEVEIYRELQSALALNGAEGLDKFTVLFGNGEFAYCRPPTDKKLQAGHYLWTDFRSTYAGYPGDRNRIARVGQPNEWEKKTYKTIRELTEALSKRIKPGMTGADVFALFEQLWQAADVGQLYLRASRVGHGGGMDLTEPPSLMQGSDEVIAEGMILHIEPKLEARGAVFQFEEIIWVQADGNDFLSEPHPVEIPVIPAQ